MVVLFRGATARAARAALPALATPIASAREHDDLASRLSCIALDGRGDYREVRRPNDLERCAEEVVLALGDPGAMARWIEHDGFVGISVLEKPAATIRLYDEDEAGVLVVRLCARTRYVCE